MKLRVGIFFGGPSREREISFAGGRTVYDNLNQQLFTPVPIFVDSHRNWVILDWEYVYKGSIRDFFPPVSALPPSANGFQVYAESLANKSYAEQEALLTKIGIPVQPGDIHQHIDLAFLALHGVYGEDGALQQELQDLGVPYTGSGVEASKIGMDKALQKVLMKEKGFACPKVRVVNRQEWLDTNIADLYEEAAGAIKFPLVIRPANQGSSIGVSIIDEEVGLEGFEKAVNLAFFRELILVDDWRQRSRTSQIAYVREVADLRSGLGFPLKVSIAKQTTVVYHPEDLLRLLDDTAQADQYAGQVIILEADQSEQDVILEAFIAGQEFSCIVLRGEEGSSIALPPTEIIKGGEVFDYKSKYMPGLSRKETPINLPNEAIEAIRRECERLFSQLGFQVYARIDGFYTASGEIFLNDPNTTSGMLPSSFFFHQAAEIGLNPSQFLTYIIRLSLQERLAEQSDKEQWRQLLRQLDQQINALKSEGAQRKRIAVILGGYSFERHISVESGRNIFEKLSSSVDYEPVPVFLTGSNDKHLLYQLPINLLLKDNADDIRDKIFNWKSHPLLEQIRRECVSITKKYASSEVIFSPASLTYDKLADKVDGVFIALHGRPGEDGQVQMYLEARGLPYNGSGVQSSNTTIDKFRTLQLLAQHDLPVANQLLLSKEDFLIDQENFSQKVEDMFGYPLIAKPVDDGCSSAVKVIRSRVQLQAYCELLFSINPEQESNQRQQLGISLKEEFSHKTEVLFEQLIRQDEGIHFLEITGGLLTHYHNGGVRYEMFEPSETLAGGEVLSLEEKFLAGEGQNLTPARFATDKYTYEHILPQVQHTLERAARLLKVEGYCRIDAFVRIHADGEAETQVIEVNSLPGMTPATAIFHQAALAGYKPAAFIQKIIAFGFERQARKKGSPTTIKEAATPAQSPAVVAAMPDSTAVTIDLSSQKESFSSMSDPSSQNPSPKDKSSYAGVVHKLSRFATFLRSKYFLKNLATMFGLVVVSFILLNVFLNVYTSHGNSVQVENYVDLGIDEATKKAKARGFKVSVNEAPFTINKPQGQIIAQEPQALNRIKKNRTIYLTMIGSPKEVGIPSFEAAADNYSRYRQNLVPLQVKCAVKESVFDAKLADSTILHFYYQGRKYLPNDVKRGVQVLQGSTLEFVVTKSNDDYVRIPALQCKRFSEVNFLLPGLDLRLGEVVGNVADRSSAYVYQQEPEYTPGGKILRGESIKIYLQEELPAGCPTEIETNAPPSDSGGLDARYNDGTSAPVDTSGGF